MKMLVKTKDEWKHYLQDAQEKSALGILEFGKRVYEYKCECDTMQGGSTFAQDVKEWLGMSKQSGSQLAKIGQEYKKLYANGIHLPPSWRSIYLISTLEDSNIQSAIDQKVINPQATRADITSFKNRLAYQEKFKKEQEKRAKEDANFKPTKKSIEDDIEKARQNKIKEKIKKKIKENDFKFSNTSAEEDFKKSEERYKNGRTWFDEQNEKFYNDIKNLFGGNNELRDPEDKEDAYLMIGKLLMAADNSELNKHILKTLKQKLHPDKFTGDCDLFKYISKIESKINE